MISPKPSLCAFCVVAAWLVAGRVHAAEPTVAQSIEALKSEDTSDRLIAIDHLAALGPKAAKAVAPLTALLNDGSPAIRAHAAHALGKIGPEAASAAPALIQRLADEDETVRRQVVAAIPALHADRQQNLAAIVKLLEDSDPAVRLRVMQTVASAGEAAVPGLIAALGNERAAYWACVVLRDIGLAAKDAVPALTKAAVDAPLETRREAILALAAMREAAEPAIPHITAALDDEHLRPAATFALGSIGKIPQDAAAKIRANVESEDAVLSLASLWALARANPDDETLQTQAVTRLTKALTNEDPWRRRTAGMALVALKPKPEAVVAELRKSLPGASEEIVRDALGVLASAGSVAVPHLIEALKHERIRADLAQILGSMGEEAAPAAPALTKLIDDPNPRVANEAILALGNIGPAAASAAPRLAQALQQTDSTAPHSAALALGKIGPAAKSVQPALIQSLKHEDPIVRVLCAWAVVQIGEKSETTARAVTPTLVEGLKAPLAETRKAAAETLGALGPTAKPAMSALRAAEKDEDPSVRDAAALALESIGAGGKTN